MLFILALLYYMCILQLDESRRREVAVAVVRQDGYDGLAGVFRPLGDFCRGMEGCAAGNADEEAFGFGKGLGCRIGFVCRDGKYFIVNRLIEGFGDEIRADTLQLMRAGMALGQERRIGRFDGYDLDGRLLFLQVLSRAAQGAAGADAGDEDIDGSICVVVDFRACRGLMDGGVGRIGKLAGNEAVQFFG